MARRTWEIIMRACASLRRARLWVCLAVGIALYLSNRRACAEPSVAAPILLRDDRGHVTAVAYPPQNASGLRPVTIMLHGMCGAPERECSSYAPAVTGRGWLLCPRAPVPCEGGGHSWSFATVDQVIEKAFSRLQSLAPLSVERQERTLVGFSLGALAAMQVAHDGQGRYRHVVLIGAKVFPDAHRLSEAGVERLLLVSGDWDMMHDHMSLQHQRLARHGFPTGFASLGKIGHAYPPDMTERMIALLGSLGAPMRGA
jgi:predicted esterase